MRSDDCCAGGVCGPVFSGEDTFGVDVNAKPLVSVIVPVFNAASFLRTTLDSVCAAARGHPGELECICVNDGSTDESESILREYAARRDAVRFVVLSQPNGGEGSARNAGIAVAAGEWLAYLDSDDVWAPEMLNRATEVMRAHPSADIVAFRLSRFRENDEPSFAPVAPRPGSRCLDTTSRIGFDVLRRTGICPTFFRRAVLGMRRFSELPIGADRLYVAECLAIARSVVLSDDVLYAYRRRAASMSGRQWGPRKIVGQLDYLCRTMSVLAGSGKSVSGRCFAYLSNLWLADVPKMIGELPPADRSRAWEPWRQSLLTQEMGLLPWRFRTAVRLLRKFGLSSCGSSLRWASALRILGVTRDN